MKLPYLALVLLPATLHAQDIALEKENTRWRFSAEVLDLPDEDVGLVGAHYDWLGILDAFPPLYAGVGGYAGVTGETAGFFLGGVTVGAAWHPAPLWVVDAGIFAGGGGQAGGGVQDGWVVRPFFAIERLFGLYGVRGEVAYYDMDAFEPEFSASLGLTLPSELLYAREARLPQQIPHDAVVQRDLRATPRLLFFEPDSGADRRDGSPLTRDVTMSGIGVDYFLTREVFFPLEVYTATGGGVDGFVQGSAGVGYSHPILNRRATVEAKVAVVVGGGGGVDTGSGSGLQGLVGARANVTPRFALEVMAGRTGYADSDFEADTLTVGLSWLTHPVELSLTYPRGNLAREGLSDADAKLESLRCVVLTKLYSPPSDALRKDGTELDGTISMIGVGFEQPVHENVVLTAHGYTSLNGDVGGYSEGLLGARFEYQAYNWDRFSVGIGLAAGGAGGGGVDVGSGLMYHTSAQLRFQLTDKAFTTLEWGKAEADTGSFEAESATLGLGVGLNRAVLRD